jgi:hypothetical protein
MITQKVRPYGAGPAIGDFQVGFTGGGNLRPNSSRTVIPGIL